MAVSGSSKAQEANRIKRKLDYAQDGMLYSTFSPNKSQTGAKFSQTQSTFIQKNIQTIASP
jgi:hypothetical protein